MLIRRTLTCALLFAAVAVSYGQVPLDQARQNWHQWRGPLASGVALDGSPPVTWDEETNIRWKIAVPGAGSATPIVWGDRLFLLTAVKTDRSAESTDESAAVPVLRSTRSIAFAQQQDQDRPGERGAGGRGQGGRGRRGGFGRGGGNPTDVHQFVVICLNRHTGETIWEKVACEVIPHEGHHGTNNYASASPFTDGERLYAYFGSRGLYCYDIEGKLQWEQDFGDMQTRAGFGEGATPVLYGDTIVVNWDHEGDSFIFAVDAATGKEKWRQPRDERTTWVTPMVVEYNGRKQVITNGSNKSIAYDLETGDVIWECGGQVANPIPSPLVCNDAAILMTGYQGFALHVVPLSATGDVTGSDQIVWSRNTSTPYVSSPILVDDKLYFTKARNAILTCVDAKTGEVHFEEERLPEMNELYASPVAADGKIYISARNGNVCVIKVSDQLEVLANNSLGETIDASPAIVGDTMYIRGAEHLFCIAED